MVWVTLPIVLLLAGVALMFIAATLLAWGLTHPPRMGDGKALAILHRMSPGDLQLGFSDLSFDVIDEAHPPAKIRIVGWWIPAADDASQKPSAPPRGMCGRTILLLHGYADAKVGAIAWAPILHELGWNILALDLRAHGESGGTVTTGGHFERHDISQVINQLRTQRPAETKKIVLFGVSMGSAVATQVAAIRDDLDGLICESFVGSFIFASHAQTHLMGLPGGWTGNLSAHIAAWMTGADFHNDTALHDIVKVTCPALLIVGTEDPFADQIAVEKVVAGMTNVQLWRPEGIDHVRAMVREYDEYRRRISEFLSVL